jgi:hypothetical protein
MPTLPGVKWHGLDTFKDELRVLTSNLVEEANAIMVESAEAAKAAIAAAYPFKQGGLRRGLVLKPVRGTLLSGAELVQTAPHGNIFERGTVVRHTHKLYARGRMPPNPTFIPIAAAYRRTAISAVIRRLYAHGASRVQSDLDLTA